MAKNDVKPAEIHDYYFKPAPVFLSTNAGGMLAYYGLEIETDNGKRSDRLMRLLSRFKEVYLKRDGSLTFNVGFEIVSYPLTLEYHDKFMQWGEIFKILDKEGYKSHETTNCGFHIHIGRNAFGESTRNQQKYMAYFTWLIYKFERELRVFSRRKDFSYCEFWRNFNLNDKPTKAFQKMVYYNKTERDLAVNTWKFPVVNGRPQAPEQLKTLEIRLFKGTLNKTTVIAAIALLETLKTLALNCKDDSDLRKIQWSDIRANAANPALIDYLNKKRL